MSGENFWSLLRQKAQKTQARMAEDAGVSIDTWRGWEGGRSVPSLASAEKVAGAVGSDPLVVLVGAAALSARKSVENGGGPEPVLRRVENLADLAEAADSARDKEVLTAGAQELLSIAQTAAKDADSEADDVTDHFGRKNKKVLDPAVGASDRDGLGRQIEKPLDRQMTAKKSSDRSDNPVDGFGRKSKKIFG